MGGDRDGFDADAGSAAGDILYNSNLVKKMNKRKLPQISQFFSHEIA